MLLKLKDSIIYGPVNSRRLGRSLGINLLPGNRKICSFNCSYCQYGWTKHFSPQAWLDELPPPVAVEQALTEALASLPEPPAFLTFSGNGEATLHPAFPEMVEVVQTVRDRHCPSARTAILSNSSEVHRPEIRSALSRLDLRIMKLDAGSPAQLAAYNQPAPDVRLPDLLAGLAGLPSLIIQTLFSGGPGGNSSPPAVESWLEAVGRLKPQRVQLYSLDRDWPGRDLQPASPAFMEAVAGRLRQAGIPACTY